MQVLHNNKKISVYKTAFMLLPFLLLLPCINIFASGDEGIYTQKTTRLTGTTNLAVNAVADNFYLDDQPLVRSIQHIITLSLNEESTTYLPLDFTASVKVKIEYGNNSVTEHSVSPDRIFTVSFDKNAGATYRARDYIKIDNWQKVRVTVLDIQTAPSSLGSLDVRNLLALDNEIRVISYYNLAAAGTPNLHYAAPSGIAIPDALPVTWDWPGGTGNNYAQLEWTWVENESATYYNGAEDIFRNNATRIDLPVNTSSYNIPLFYDGIGKLYYRIRAVSIRNNGSRTDGPWWYSNTNPLLSYFTFNGHNNDLNWQVTTSYAEEGKRKTVMQYYDGSLRNRQTVTKDNTTNTTVTAETFYDGQGRPAVQVLPAPGIDNVIAYRKGLNLFNGPGNTVQNIADNPADFFDLQPVGSNAKTTQPLNTGDGASGYYSPANIEINSGRNTKLPDAAGYPYTVTRYTPDATGRVMMQSGVGDTFKMGGGHEIKYYYGTASQEELDGLFGTEVGDYAHYFKNMVSDANGQMSVSYVDMHGRTVATALAGTAPTGMQALDNNQYVNQAGTAITRNLVNANSNTVKGNSIEVINTLLVPVSTSYAFNYQLTPKALKLPQCTGPDLCFDCMYNLEISVVDESGDNPPIVRKFSNIQLSPDDNCSTTTPDFSPQGNNISFTEVLGPGSYIIRKTLTLSESTMETYRQDYLVKGLCKTQQQLIDSIYTVLKSVTGCDAATPPTPLDCASCKAALGLKSDFETTYANSLGIAPPYSAAFKADMDAAYNDAMASCNKLCTEVSHRLDAVEEQMLNDMTPYSGQYAQNPAPHELPVLNDAGRPMNRGTLYNTWDIFKAGKYKTPSGDYNGKTNNYYNAAGQVDPTITPVPNTISPDGFTQLFSNTWAVSLMPYHPEYAKLKFAKNNLQAAYTWADNIEQVSSYSDAQSAGYIPNPSAADPLFTITAGNTTVLNKSATVMQQYVHGSGSNAWYNGLTFWQLAYGDAKCKSITNTSGRNTCYTNAPKKPDATYNSLTAAEKDNIWAAFRNFYITVRDSITNDYLKNSVPLTNATALMNDGYLLRFPLSNSQQAQQYNWTWYPAGDGPINGNTLPGVNMTDAINTSNNLACSSYKNSWKTALFNCVAVATSPDKDQILNDITSRMEVLCQKGTDRANPFGSSTLPGGTVMPNGDVSFEQIINSVLSLHHIDKDLYCNPYVIEYPKPYGKNPQYTTHIAGILDTCTCKQFGKITAAATAANYDAANLGSFNSYLRNKYNDTITLSLFNGLQHCAELGASNCSDTTVANGGCSTGSAVDTLDIVHQRNSAYPFVYTARTIIRIFQGFRSRDNDSFRVQIDTSLLPCQPLNAPSGSRYTTQNGIVTTTRSISLASPWGNDFTPPDAIDTSIGFLGNGFTGGTLKCDTALWYYALPQAQPLPEFLICGFTDNDTHCVFCRTLSTLTAEFKGIFPVYNTAPLFGSENITDAQVDANILFARFINYRTGMQYSWLDYAKAAHDKGCNLDNYQTNTNDADVICGSSRPLTDTTGIFTHDNPCQRAYNMAVYIATDIYEKRKQQLLANFEAAWRSKCLSAKADERFTVTYTSSEYHYTLYYYDMAGNLVKTVPPKGVRPNFTNAATVEQARIDGTDVLMQHVLVTDYRYNSLNQVVAQHTPDANNSQFWYDRLGRLVVSQNAKQYAGSEYSYTLYDLLGRINEVGELTSSNAITENTSKSGDLLGTWMDAAQSSKTQITKTTYDFAYFDGDNFISLVPYITQENLRNRVSWTALYNTYADLIQSDHAGQATATFYTYDVHGNVGTLLQDYKQGIMATSAGGNRYKKIVYDYDLISGKVNKVSYQPGEKDAFYHRYSYDAENRITEVYTSSDDIYWDERDAHYQYYKHGPLSRTELGKLGVQGIDYTYTLQGWLKSINQSAVDLSGVNGTCAAGTGPDILTVNDRPAINAPAEYKAGTSIFFEEGFQNGIDDYFDAVVDPNTPACVNNTATADYGTAGAETIPVARDAYNVILSYYDNDYTGIGAVSPSYGMAGKLGGDYHALFNGNISSMAVNVGKLGKPLVYAYQYDQLNRLVNMNAYKSSNESWTALTTTNNYKEVLSYDANGNILSYLRNGAGTTEKLNNYTYSYTANTNRLATISNSVNSNNATYGYDDIGNVIKDDKQNVSLNKWNVYSKLESVQKTDGNTISYTYDAGGNRISKTAGNVTEWYVRDGTGKIMCVYTTGDNKINTGHLTLSEVHKYGSGRLGMSKLNIDATLTVNNTITLDNGEPGYTYSFTRGVTEYELTDANGNILATVSDKKHQHTSDDLTVDYYLPDVITAEQYSSFGAISSSYNSYNLKQAFNGQRRSTEISPTAQTAEFWEYNGDVGRRWNTDPITKEFESPYVAFSNNPIARVDVLGNADTTVNEAGGGHTIKTDNAVNSLQFYGSSDYNISGTTTKVPVQTGQLRSFSNALGTFNASWKTDADGNPVFAGYLNDKNKTVETVVNELIKFSSSWKYKLFKWADDDLHRYAEDPVGFNLSMVTNMLIMSATAAVEPAPPKFGYNPSVTTAESMSALGTLKFATKEGGLTLFKFGSPQAETPTGWKTGSRFLRLLDLGSPKLNWKQNSGLLRREMGSGNPIFDSYIGPRGTLQETRGFLNAERNLLQSRGWNFKSGTRAWMPPQ